MLSVQRHGQCMGSAQGQSQPPFKATSYRPSQMVRMKTFWWANPWLLCEQWTERRAIWKSVCENKIQKKLKIKIIWHNIYQPAFRWYECRRGTLGGKQQQKCCTAKVPHWVCQEECWVGGEGEWQSFGRPGISWGCRNSVSLISSHAKLKLGREGNQRIYVSLKITVT